MTWRRDQANLEDINMTLPMNHKPKIWRQYYGQSDN